MKKYIFILLALFLSTYSWAQRQITKDTYTYAVKDGIELKLDKYDLTGRPAQPLKPCVIFLFGGGFVNGERDSERYTSYFHELTERGNIVVSIDYRKYLHGFDFSTISLSNKEEFAKLLVQTINVATEDLFNATSFILKQADEFGIDTTAIIISGSSAGAITVLQGEYFLINRHPLATILPSDFRYAGVVSFAGAVFTTESPLKWKEPPAPMLLFHGNADKNVPYDAVELEGAGFYGSKYIVKQLEELAIPYQFYDEEYAAHELADTPMQNQLELITNFIQREVVAKEGLQIHTMVKKIGKDVVKTDFSLEDYIQMNYGK
ncbi:carboxylesterase family protein [Massilibacteroides sp.]|uniref:alpha/beta hydrolase n=1 Tax=Massilibacteroides sp. TaxID=2034766 RepID=UPI002623DECB|nr:carboxylesterase family protein [Massilibacteroides sp.]MDD4514811.1 carboxylesterase family protein [Massilibacteroides sp.]